MAHAWYIDELIAKHSAIMDRYDPARRVKLIVDEWGTWYAPPPTPSRSTLFQQQTLRDALVSALNFHAFIGRAEHVHMANAAQVCNVLHSVLLTDGPVTVRTPNWHAFHLFTPHQDAQRLTITGDIPLLEDDGLTYPRLSVAASRAADGAITVTLAHTDPTESLEIDLRGLPTSSKPVARILTAGRLNDYNSPKDSDRVASRPWTDFTCHADCLKATLPPACVIALTYPT